MSAKITLSKIQTWRWISAGLALVLLSHNGEGFLNRLVGTIEDILAIG